MQNLWLFRLTIAIDPHLILDVRPVRIVDWVVGQRSIPVGDRRDVKLGLAKDRPYRIQSVCVDRMDGSSYSI